MVLPWPLLCSLSSTPTLVGAPIVGAPMASGPEPTCLILAILHQHLSLLGRRMFVGNLQTLLCAQCEGLRVGSRIGLVTSFISAQICLIQWWLCRTDAPLQRALPLQEGGSGAHSTCGLRVCAPSMQGNCASTPTPTVCVADGRAFTL